MKATYRRVAGIDTDIAKAAERARREADDVPEPKKKRRRRED